MDIKADLASLNKKIIYSASPDTPDTLYVIVPEANPATPAPVDQVRLETYVRVKSLPVDLMRLVMTANEAKIISNKIAEAVPYLPKASPTHYPSGVVELQWKLDKGGVFGIVLHNFSFSLEFENKEFSVSRKGKIGWRFHAPGTHPQNGEFKTVEELIDFMGKCFVHTP